MRISRVEIERFLCFNRLSVDVDPALQLLAGPNNAGKSSLIRLLEAFFRGPAGEDLVPLVPAHDYYRHLGPRTLSSIQVWFTDLTEDERAACGPAVRRDGQFWVSVRCSRSGSVSFAASRRVDGEQARRVYDYVLVHHHFVKIPSVRVGSAGDPEQPASLERLLDTLEAVLIRTGSARSTALQQQFAQCAEPVEELVREVLDESARAIHAELPFQEGEVRFRLRSFRHALRGMLEAAAIESHGDACVPVAERGTGFQSALVLGILRYVAAREAQQDHNVVVAIEEPEAFLHPQTQRAVARIIRTVLASAQVLVTTHSSVIVDSFAIARIARLPLQSGGTSHTWRRPDLTDVQAGQLSHYCSAANSELVFANAVIFVEGEGDRGVVELLLSRICRAPGGHYARGVTVVEAAGLTKVKHLVALAETFRVRSFVLADKDGLRRHAGSRVLLQVLSARHTPPGDEAVSLLRTVADRDCNTATQALQAQRQLNRILAQVDAFTLASDLEGLLLDSYGTDGLARALGPEGEGVLDEQFLRQLDGAGDARERLAARIGSRGWNCDRRTSGKLDPHIPRLLCERLLDSRPETPVALRPLLEWLERVVDEAAPTPL